MFFEKEKKKGENENRTEKEIKIKEHLKTFHQQCKYVRNALLHFI